MQYMYYEYLRLLIGTIQWSIRILSAYIPDMVIII